MDLKGLILFDIDGVIRDVSSSYRLALQKTVNHFCGWEPSIKDIDDLKSEGPWNNDWDASLELIKRHIAKTKISIKSPSRKEIESIFNHFYFGENPSVNPNEWSGLIKNETLLVEKKLFDQLTAQKLGWGFVSGAERASAKFVLENQLGLENPPLISMKDAPEKPDPTGLIELSKKLLNSELGLSTPLIAYLGDTVADVITIQNARKKFPQQRFLSLAISPPHLHIKENMLNRLAYEAKLKKAGANVIIRSTKEVIDVINFYLENI